MRPIDLAKTTTALSAYRASDTAKASKPAAKAKDPLLSDGITISISEEGKKLAAENPEKYSNLRIMKINNRNYH